MTEKFWKYEIGQELWRIGKVFVREPCPYCGDTGTVEGADNQQLECARCNSEDGADHMGGETHWEVAGRSQRADWINVQITKSTVDVRYSLDDMSFGNVPEEDVRPSKAEAQAECDRRNEEDASDARDAG